MILTSSNIRLISCTHKQKPYSRYTYFHLGHDHSNVGYVPSKYICYAYSCLGCRQVRAKRWNSKKRLGLSGEECRVSPACKHASDKYNTTWFFLPVRVGPGITFIRR